MVMNCQRVDNLMSAYIDGELTGAEMLAIRRHLHDCQDCAEEYESMRVVKQAVGRLRNVAPRQDFAQAILARVEEIQVPTHQRMLDALTRFVNSRLSPVAAALVASGVALVLLTAGGIDGVVPQNTAPAMAAVSAHNVSFIRESNQPTVPMTPTQPFMVEEKTVSQPEMLFASLTR